MVPSNPLPMGSIAMTCSRLVSTICASATRPLFFMASRMTANASSPTLVLGHDVIRPIEVAPVDLVHRHELLNVQRVGALHLDGFDLLGFDLDVLALGDFIA